MLHKSTGGCFLTHSLCEENQALTNPLPCPVSPHALQSPGRGEPPRFTIHLTADKFEAQRAGAAAHHGVDADELGGDGRVEHVGLHGAIVHVPLENLQRRPGMNTQALPQPPASNPTCYRSAPQIVTERWFASLTQ